MNKVVFYKFKGLRQQDSQNKQKKVDVSIYFQIVLRTYGGTLNKNSKNKSLERQISLELLKIVTTWGCICIYS